MRKAVIRKASKQTYTIDETPYNMWYADLWCCATKMDGPRRIQYWSFGAVLGFVLEHFRRDHRHDEAHSHS